MKTILFMLIALSVFATDTIIYNYNDTTISGDTKHYFDSLIAVEEFEFVSIMNSNQDIYLPTEQALSVGICINDTNVYEVMFLGTPTTNGTTMRITYGQESYEEHCPWFPGIDHRISIIKEVDSILFIIEYNELGIDTLFTTYNNDAIYNIKPYIYNLNSSTSFCSNYINVIHADPVSIAHQAIKPISLNFNANSNINVYTINGRLVGSGRDMNRITADLSNGQYIMRQGGMICKLRVNH